ncbi:suppressor of fused domain protein [Gorillibacterium sp. CAU 1737]|uniref:suppressor of fused domain protein n=1 Tax=Gorillibacterium sp. CAU 1737 TaxID=3140362 RepID=UPI003260E920
MSEEVEATIGWDAIEEQMRGLYGEQEPKHYGTLIPYQLGGKDPLDGISAYAAEEPTPHWHIVTFGFSELYGKESDYAEESGYGFELTFRVARENNEEEPPAWALNLLQNMGRYVFSSGNVFRSGDYLDANGPICLGADTELTALAFVEDPELPAIDTPNGRVVFLQMVGITGDELEAMKTWNTRGMLRICEGYMPRYITNLSRHSLLEVPAIAEEVQKGIERDGSNTGFLFVDQLEWEPEKKRLFGKAPAVLTIGAKQAETIGKLIRGRISKNKELALVSRTVRVVLKPSDQAKVEEGEDEVVLYLTEAAVHELASQLKPQEGTGKLSALDGITLTIVKTHIKDPDGTIVSTIG